MEKTISNRIVFRCPKFVVEEELVELPNGQIVNRWYVRKQDFIGIIPVDSDGNILLTREYRSAYKNYAWGVPGGGREDREKPIEAAHRELREETGYDSRNLTLFYESDTIFATIKEKQYVYIAKDLFQSPLIKNEWEEIEIHPTKPENILEFIVGGLIQDKVAVALFRYLNK